MIETKEDRTKNDIVDNEKKLIQVLILQAIKNGKSFCEYEGFISAKTVDWLKSLGYIIERKDSFGSTKIYW